MWFYLGFAIKQVRGRLGGPLISIRVVCEAKQNFLALPGCLPVARTIPIRTTRCPAVCMGAA